MSRRSRAQRRRSATGRRAQPEARAERRLQEQPAAEPDRRRDGARERAPDRGPRARRTEPLAPQERLAVYRREASYGQLMRIALVVGLAALDLAAAVRLAGGTEPLVLGYVAFVCLLFFFGSGVVKHYRALYRIQRHHREAWPPPFAAMLLAPFGVGLSVTRLDRLLLRATVVLAVGLVAVLIPSQLRHR